MKNYKIILLLACLFLGLNIEISSQSVSLRGITMMPIIVEHEGNLIVTGTSLVKGPFASKSKVYFLNENLEEEWSYNLDEFHSNLIGEVAVFDDKIFISGMEGKVGNTWEDTRRFILILDMKGNLIVKEQVGIIQYMQSTPLVKVDNEILIYYSTDTTVARNPPGEYFSLNLSSISLDDLSIEDGPVSFDQKLRTGRPCDIMHSNDKSYLIGLSDVGYDTYFFLKPMEENSQEEMKFISTDLLTIYNLKISTGDQTKFLYNINGYGKGWQGYLVNQDEIFSQDSLSKTTPSIRFENRPNDIYGFKDQVFYIDEIEYYKKYDLVISDLSGNILSREPLDFKPEKIVVNEDYYYFLDNSRGVKIIRKRR